MVDVNVDYEYAYGLLSSIHDCDYAVLDMDKIPYEYKYFDKSKVIHTKTERNSAKMLELIANELMDRFDNIERIDIIRSSLILTNVNDKTGHVSWDTPVHLYVKFNDAYNLEPFYKDVFVSQIICGGFLTFISYNGYMNIRISKKYNHKDPDIRTKVIHKFIPIVSFVGKKEIKYPEYNRIRNKRSETCEF